MQKYIALMTACAMLPLCTGCGIIPGMVAMMTNNSSKETVETITEAPTDTTFYDDGEDVEDPSDYEDWTDWTDWGDLEDDGPYWDGTSVWDDEVETEEETISDDGSEYNVRLADWADVQWTQYQCAYFTVMIPEGWVVDWNGNAERLIWNATAPDLTLVGCSNIDHLTAAKDERVAAVTGFMTLYNGTVQEFYETLYKDTTDYFTVQNSCVPDNKEQLQAMRQDKAIWDYESLYALFSENGVEGEGVYSAAIMEAPDLILTGGYNYAMWEINGCFMEWAPRGELVNWQPVYKQIAQSFTYTDYYWQEWRDRLNQPLPSDTSSSINDPDPIVEAFEERMNDDTILQEKRSDMIGEYERVYDNETGNIYRAYDGFLDDIGSDQTKYSPITDSQYADGYVGWIDKWD